jgi:hypothetical protein
MKNRVLLFVIFALFPLLFSATTDPSYVVLGWNDLGMHCSNKDFSKLAILPPYNNLLVQVIQKGNGSNMPVVVTTGYHVTYEIPGNTYSDGKTNFWTYVNQLFGVTPAPNIGLTGAGLAGNMNVTDNYFHIEGIPVTAYPDSDLVSMHPYQLALMKVFDNNSNLLGQTQNVIPVSHEISCVSGGCHGSEQGIRNAHPNVNGYNTTQPLLCASCHADPALGTTGTPNAGYFSKVIHGAHGSETNNCYKCHPGTITQCYRDVMYANGFTCQHCHGSVSQVASSINSGRIPWHQEPSCAMSGCHDADHAPNNGVLYRQSKGHGGLFCSACHGSPHAIVPTNQPNDNLQNIMYQGFAGKLEVCSVCHGITPNLPGPHGYLPTAIHEVQQGIPVMNGFASIFPNPAAQGEVQIMIQVKDAGNYSVQLFDLSGRQVALIAHEDFPAGTYSLPVNTKALSAGTYLARFSGNHASDTRKFIMQ